MYWRVGFLQPAITLILPDADAGEFLNRCAKRMGCGRFVSLLFHPDGLFRIFPIRSIANSIHSRIGGGRKNFFTGRLRLQPGKSLGVGMLSGLSVHGQHHSRKRQNLETAEELFTQRMVA